MATERVFNSRRRLVLRKHIPAGEVAAGLAIVGVLALVLAWVAVQGDNYNAAERDLPYELLASQPVEDRLYRVPLKAWSEPGVAGLAGRVAERVQLGAFPPAILEGGWALSARPRSFGPDTLFRKINGEAEKFLRLGFRELHYVALKAPGKGAEIGVELFDQGSFAGALGAFSVHRADDRPVERQGRALFFRTPVGAIGFAGRYFFRMAGSEASAQVRGKTGQLVGTLAALPGSEAEPPHPHRVLTEGMGVAPGEVAYQKKNVFQYGFAEDFWFGKLNEKGSARLFLHEAGSGEAAGRLYGQIAAEHRMELEVLRDTETEVLMRHEFLKTHFAMAVAGQRIYGVENEPDAARIGPLMRRFAERLGSEK
jgi:hypothetical protein